MAQAPHPRMHGLTHVTGGADPIPGLPQWPTGDTMDERILAALPAGFWKLNESSGTVAADSSGNGQDLSTTGVEAAPLWGFPAGPPGEPAASFATPAGADPGAAGTASRVSRPWPAVTGSFTAGIWVNRTSNLFCFVMGQVGPGGGGSSGWEIEISAYNTSPVGTAANRPQASLKRSSGVEYILALNPLLPGTWAFVALVYDAAAAQAKLYVNGLLDATSPPFTFVPAVGINPQLYVGHVGQLQHFRSDMAGSYAFLVNRAMSGTELSGIVAAPGADVPTVTDTTEWVPTDDGTGGLVMQPPGVTVEHGDGEPDPTPTAGPSFGGATSTSGWHLDAHTEIAVLYDSSPGRFDVPSQKWVRVPFNTVRFWRTWEPTVGAANTTTEWLPDDRGLTPQARDGILHITAGMEGTPDPVDGYHQYVVYWPFSPEWPFLDWSKLPNSPISLPGIDPANIDAYVRAARAVDLSHGFVLRDSAAPAGYRQFFEWNMWFGADDTEEWVAYNVDNPYPVYPVWPGRPLVLPGPYPKLTERASGQYYKPQKTVSTSVTLAAGSNLCVQAWQDSPWLLRFSTDTYRIPYPGLTPKYVLRPHLAVGYRYDPETIDHTTGKLL